MVSAVLGVLGSVLIRIFMHDLDLKCRVLWQAQDGLAAFDGLYFGAKDVLLEVDTIESLLQSILRSPDGFPLAFLPGVS